MQIVRPIFILGSGRSGTSILYNLLATHPDVCWFSNIVNSYPNHPELAIMNRITDVPLIRGYIKKSIIKSSSTSFIYPSEGENIYTYCGFKDDQKMLEPTPDIKMDKFKKIVALHLALTGKQRFLNKRTANTQRLGVIQALFPDAFYIHIIRDGRAVSYSLLQSSWWPNVRLWWLKGKQPSGWNREGKEPISLCALHWKHNVEEIINYSKKLAPRYIEIRYEDLVNDVVGSLKRLLTFCKLSLSKTYLSNLPNALPNMNAKWSAELTRHQKEILQKEIGPFAKSMGYV